MRPLFDEFFAWARAARKTVVGGREEREDGHSFLS